MALNTELKIGHMSAALLFVVVFTAKAHILNEDAWPSPPCIRKDFNDSITDFAKKDYKICYVFSYTFSLPQNWAANICIRSRKASQHAPLLVVVRESLSVMAFQVPQVFLKSSFHEVCHTLCPLANYFDKQVATKQDIFVEVTTQSTIAVEFEMTLSKMDQFIIAEEQSLKVNITPSHPRVMQYNMNETLQAVRIEAESTDEDCMVLAIQNITCPFYDSERTVEKSGFYQTLMKQSGIAITKKNFPGGKVYIVLILKPTNKDCIEKNFIKLQQSKEVTVRIVPAITDEEYYEAVFGALGFYLLIYIFSFIICIFIFFKKKRNSAAAQTTDIENTSGQSYGTPSTEDEVPSDWRIWRAITMFLGRRCSDGTDETDMDTLPDVTDDRNLLRTRIVLYVADLARKDDKDLSKSTKLYTWNLLTTAIFYGLPVVQLVYINQRIVNVTGNQDLCYYNFLCSHQVWIFSDFNHVYSNIGYILLGILFLFLVWRRESMHTHALKDRNRNGQQELTGIPHHFGLMYAMGWALVMEGVLSASYHVCPNKTNFQFDTAFMYVISTICMLKLYQARHPDITAKSHTTWMLLSVVVIIGVAGIIKEGIIFWLLFVFAHLVVTLTVSVKIYYMGCCKFNRGLFRRVAQVCCSFQTCCSFSPQYLGRFIVLTSAVLLNIVADLYGLIKQPPSFATFLLGIFIMNLLMYLLYYTVMKIRCRESIRWIPIMYIFLSVLCWGPALYFFFTVNTSWEVTPSESRELNKHCLILNFFDDHDIWHFLSSCALFFSFMVLFTLDDDLESTPRTQIIVF